VNFYFQKHQHQSLKEKKDMWHSINRPAPLECHKLFEWTLTDGFHMTKKEDKFKDDWFGEQFSRLSPVCFNCTHILVNAKISLIDFRLQQWSPSAWTFDTSESENHEGPPINTDSESVWWWWPNPGRLSENTVSGKASSKMKTWRRSYKKKFCLKKSILVLNSLTVFLLQFRN
jgi:hypothetical protein